MESKMDWKVWGKGLVAAVVMGVANAVTLVIVEPLTFNLDEGFNSLIKAAVVSGILAGAAYLKQSPLPQ